MRLSQISDTCQPQDVERDVRNKSDHMNRVATLNSFLSIKNTAMGRREKQASQWRRKMLDFCGGWWSKLHADSKLRSHSCLLILRGRLCPLAPSPTLVLTPLRSHNPVHHVHVNNSKKNTKAMHRSSLSQFSVTRSKSSNVKAGS